MHSHKTCTKIRPAKSPYFFSIPVLSEVGRRTCDVRKSQQLMICRITSNLRPAILTGGVKNSLFCWDWILWGRLSRQFYIDRICSFWIYFLQLDKLRYSGKNIIGKKLRSTVIYSWIWEPIRDLFILCLLYII